MIHKISSFRDGDGLLEWVTADLTAKTHWDDRAFDVIIDKATLDALLTSKKSAEVKQGDIDSSAAVSTESAGSDHQQWGDTTAGDLAGVTAYIAEMRRLVANGANLVPYLSIALVYKLVLRVRNITCCVRVSSLCQECLNVAAIFNSNIFRDGSAVSCW